MTLKESIELLQEALRIHTNTLEQLGATGYAEDLRQAWRVIEEKLKESSGESQELLDKSLYNRAVDRLFRKPGGCTHNDLNTLNLAWKDLKDIIKDSSGETQQDLQTPSSGKDATTLEPFCVLVDEAQCEELLKTVEVYRNWEWYADQYPTQWSPFRRQNLINKYPIVFYPEDKYITFCLDDSSDKPEIPFDKALQIIQSL